MSLYSSTLISNQLFSSLHPFCYDNFSEPPHVLVISSAVEHNAIKDICDTSSPELFTFDLSERNLFGKAVLCWSRNSNRPIRLFFLIINKDYLCFTATSFDCTTISFIVSLLSSCDDTQADPPVRSAFRLGARNWSAYAQLSVTAI